MAISADHKVENVIESTMPLQEILRRLDSLTRLKPELVEAAIFFRALLPLLHSAKADVLSYSIDKDLARGKLAKGIPLLVDEELPIETHKTRELFLRVCGVIDAGGTDREAARHIRLAVEQDRFDLEEVLQAAAAGKQDMLETLAILYDLDAGFLKKAARYSLLPTLNAWAQAAAHTVDLDGWQRGSCPVCGSMPILSEVQDKSGARHLRCGLCGAAWYFPRLECPFCQNDDYRSLVMFSVNGEENKYRLQSCEACRGYMKVVVTFEHAELGLLILEDLATLHLDLIAQDRGFHRVPPLEAPAGG